MTNYSLLFLLLLLFIKKKNAVPHHLRLNRESVQQELVDTTCSAKKHEDKGFSSAKSNIQKDKYTKSHALYR